MLEDMNELIEGNDILRIRKVFNKANEQKHIPTITTERHLMLAS